MLSILRAAAIIGAVVWTFNLYQAWSGLNQVSGFGALGQMAISLSGAKETLILHTIGATFLWLFGLFGGVFGGDDSEEHADTRQCPHCAETIKAAATLCRFCGSTVEPVTSAVKEPVAPESLTKTMKSSASHTRARFAGRH